MSEPGVEVGLWGQMQAGGMKISGTHSQGSACPTPCKQYHSVSSIPSFVTTTTPPPARSKGNLLKTRQVQVLQIQR